MLAAALALAGQRLTAQPSPASPTRSVAIDVAPPTASAATSSDAAGALRLDAGRFTVVAFPRDLQLARSLLRSARAHDSFPGLPRPAARVLIAIAPDAAMFRQWVGPTAPDWGEAIAIPALGRVVMKGRWGGAGGGDPRVVLRHELAHLALAEALGDLPPRWFDEGYASYAAGEWGRDEVLTANVALLFHRMPRLDSLDERFVHGASEAEGAYALAHRAVAELAAMDPERGLSLFFGYWRESGRLDTAVRRAYGLTLAAFEERWQSRTRRRYGVLALLGELSVGAGFALLVILPLYVIRRRRDRLRWAELRRADAAALALEAAVLADPSDDGVGEACKPSLDTDFRAV
ncbi:MAG TPA: hypothetical protein VFS08_21005 [Gemmatimonadaceae bacterium]|nr:hypothetical protein [Gemmatimonadaceae bacterium]